MVTVDFVARGTDQSWQMVLVEEGPWTGPIETELRRIQQRLYGCLDAAIDGQLANQFPDSFGKKIVIRLDCYNVPRDEVVNFFQRFSIGVFQTADYRDANESARFTNGISFEITFDTID